MPKKQKTKPSALSGVYNKFLGLDMFATTASFEIDGEGSYTTCIGAIISILILVFVIPYAARKYDKMVQFGDTSYAEQTL